MAPHVPRAKKDDGLDASTCPNLSLSTPNYQLGSLPRGASFAPSPRLPGASTFRRPRSHGEICTAVRHYPAREAQWADFPAWVTPTCTLPTTQKASANFTLTRRPPRKWSHAGKNVVIVTPTASGKTLCYNLPVLDAILENPDTRALYLFPTKALAQDQLAELHDLNERSQIASAYSPMTATRPPMPAKPSAKKATSS